MHVGCYAEGADFGTKLIFSCCAPLSVSAFVVLIRVAVVMVKKGKVLGSGDSGGIKYVLMVRTCLCRVLYLRVC